MHEKAMKFMMGKKKDREMSPEEKSAKQSVLEELRKQAMDAMGEGLSGAGRKPSPANSPEDLSQTKDLAGQSEGAQKACDECGKVGCSEHGNTDEEAKEDYAGQEHGRGYTGGEGSPEEEASETPEEEDQEDHELSPEEIDHKIAKLQAIKDKKSQGHHQA